MEPMIQYMDPMVYGANGTVYGAYGTVYGAYGTAYGIWSIFTYLSNTDKFQIGIWSIVPLRWPAQEH